MTEPTSTDAWLDDLRSQTTDHLQRIARLHEQLSSVYADASTAGGRVLVRVNPAGRPTAITLSAPATSMPPDDLAAAILRAVDEAAGRACALLAALLAEMVPPEEVTAMLTGTATPGDRAAVREELLGL